MSRYYDTVTHRFVNADGYFTTGLNPLDANMNIYCRNNPVMCADYNGNWTFSIGISGSIGALIGMGGGFSIAFDGEGNIALQGNTSYCDFSGKSDNIFAGASLFAGIGLNLSYVWDDVNVYDLETTGTTQIGASGGYEFAGGADIIFFDKEAYPVGASISAGVGAGADIHVMRTNTKNLAVWNPWKDTSYSNTRYKSSVNKNSNTKKTSSKNNSNKNSKPKYKRCIICGCPHIRISF